MKPKLAPIPALRTLAPMLLVACNKQIRKESRNSSKTTQVTPKIVTTFYKWITQEQYCEVLLQKTAKKHGKNANVYAASFPGLSLCWAYRGGSPGNEVNVFGVLQIFFGNMRDAEILVFSHLLSKKNNQLHWPKRRQNFRQPMKFIVFFYV